MSYKTEHVTLYDATNDVVHDYDPKELRVSHSLKASETATDSRLWDLELDDQPELSLRGDLRVVGDSQQAEINIGESGEYPQKISMSNGFSVFEAESQSKIVVNKGSWSDVDIEASGTVRAPTFRANSLGMRDGSGGTTTIWYTSGSYNTNIVRNYANDPTLWTLRSRAGDPTTDQREATLALVRTDDSGNEEYLDLFNNGYHGAGGDISVKHGMLVQKRGTGQYRPFVLGWYDGGTGKDLALQLESADQANGKRFRFLEDVEIEAADLKADNIKPNSNSVISFNSTRLVDLTDPQNSQDAATKSWADNKFSTTDTNTQDPHDLYVDGSNVDFNVEDLDLRGETGSGIDLTGVDAGSSATGDTTVKFSVDESEVNHDSLSGGTTSDAHHTRPSAGTLLSEDAAQNFNVNESNIDHNNLTNSSDSDAHHTRPSAGNELNENSNNFNVNDPLSLTELRLLTLREQVGQDYIDVKDNNGNSAQGELASLTGIVAFGRFSVSDSSSGTWTRTLNVDEASSSGWNDGTLSVQLDVSFSASTTMIPIAGSTEGAATWNVTGTNTLEIDHSNTAGGQVSFIIVGWESGMV